MTRTWPEFQDRWWSESWGNDVDRFGLDEALCFQVLGFRLDFDLDFVLLLE